MTSESATVSQLLGAIRDVGRDPLRGGYTRFTYGPADRELREWFTTEATRRSMDVETDRNGALWAWRPRPGGSLDDAVTTGSHLDSVPGGSEFDGPLGIASALAAVDLLDARGASFDRALAIVAFPEEEGGRFGQACLGSRLMTGALDPADALLLRDDDGVSLADALAGIGLDPSRTGRDDEALARIGCFVELHVEQGRGLVDLDRAVAVGSSIIGHGLWRLAVSGQGNHAGATLMTHRRDPMIAAAAVVGAVRDAAAATPGARATIGRVQALPGGTNVIASRVDLWIDVRHPDDSAVTELVARILRHARSVAAAEGCEVTLQEQSYGHAVHFDREFRDRLTSVLGAPPVLAAGAGHDAGVLADLVPTAMLFTRNPTGISHSPEEYVEDVDAQSGAVALADVLGDLLGGAGETAPAEQREP